MRVLADCAVVHGAPAGLEEEEAVEVLEEEGVGLVDRAQDRNPAGGEFAEEANDVVRRLAVEARGRLVEEEEELRLGRELDADRNALAALDRQAEAGESDHGIGHVLELKELDDLLDVGVFLGLGDVRRLAQVGRVAQRLAHRRRVLVDVLLLDVRRTALELAPGRATCDEALAADDADRLAVRKDVEERRLAGAGRAHEGGELAGTDVTADMVEELTMAARDRDGVAAREGSERVSGRQDELKRRR